VVVWVIDGVTRVAPAEVVRVTLARCQAPLPAIVAVADAGMVALSCSLSWMVVPLGALTQVENVYGADALTVTAAPVVPDPAEAAVWILRDATPN
jgi:hypothetical protein